MAPPALELAGRLGLAFRDASLLEQALIHSSYVNEQPGAGLGSNERLEFLGDAILSLIISEVLWSRHPDEPEGALTSRRAAIVSTTGLARIAGRLGLGDAICLGQGAQRTGERRRPSVLAATFEAVVAALYLDQGLAPTRAFVLRSAAPELDAAMSPDALKPPKGRLQERSFAASGQGPSYRVVSVEGPDHDRHFVVEVSLDGKALARGEGRNRRTAETEAAVVALRALDAEAR